MTKYVPEPTQWEAIRYTGANLSDVAEAVMSAGGDLLIHPVTEVPYVFARLQHGDTIFLGSLDTDYMPWLLYVPDPYSNPVRDGEQQILVAPWSDTQDGPRRWSAVTPPDE